tara:strand:- start:54 stop:647 length:594 start_codon:yes stop_codon:yes gene_type:complete
VWDEAWPISDYTGCTVDCCDNTTCGCCEPDLKTAGLLLPGQALTWQALGATQWYNNHVMYTFQENECFTFPHDLGTGTGTNSGNLSGFWNYGSGTLSGGCCVCCVAGGPGGNPNPLGNFVPGDCFWEATTTAVRPSGPSIGDPSWETDGMGNVLHDTTVGGGTLGVIDVQFYNHTGQWVTCGVKELCQSCGTPLTPL